MNIEEDIRAITAETAAPDGEVTEQVRWLAGEVQRLNTAVTETASELERLRPLEAELERLQPLEAEVERLRPLADAGAQYRSDLIESAIAEGVRAHGESFAQETYRAMLEASTLDIIKRMRDDWQAIGDQRFQAGRQTEETKEETEPVAEDALPAEAYTS